MSLVLLIVCAGLGATASAWGLAGPERRARFGAAVGILALLLVVIIVFAMDAPQIEEGGRPGPGSPLGGLLVTSAYLRLVVGLWALMSVLVTAIAWLLGGRSALRGLLPATLAAIAGGTISLAAVSLELAAAAAAATGLAALLIVLPGRGPASVAAAARELRTSLLGGAILLAAVAALPVLAQLVLLGRGGGTTSGGGTAAGAEVDAGIGLVLLAGTAAVAIRYGVLPFHLRIPRLADVVDPVGLPLLLAWIPLPIAVVSITALDTLVAPLALPLSGERLILVAFAALTLGGAALAAYLQDDLRHLTGYLVVADAGLLILAAAALDPLAWGPARAWIVVLAASKTALGAWTAVTENRFGTRSIPDLRGWMRRSPLLAAALVLTALATYGLPGWVAFEARATLTSLAADGAGSMLLLLATFLTLPAYLRLLVLGTGQVTSRVDGAAPERIAWRPRRTRDESLPVEMEGLDLHATGAERAATAPPADGDEAAVEAAATPTVTSGARRRVGATMQSALAAGERVRSAGPAQSVSIRLSAALRRDRAELLSGAVLALAILAALTSWGALDIGGASAEPAPIVMGSNGD